MRKANQIDIRFLAFLLAIVMLMISLPIHIFAEDRVGKVSILHDGSSVNEVALVEDSKLTLTTETKNI
jgi:MFS-type transporter involved in bile tolerance (Atg22 family)